MILFPAIDLKDGQCVRLKKGDMRRVCVFNDNPADQARTFEAAGFEFLHIVDLNGAFAGHAVNGEAVRAILTTISIPVQLGGGIRTMADIDSWLQQGVTRVILGTIAVREPELVARACAQYPGRIVVGIDARAGQVAVSGWGTSGNISALELALRFKDVGVAAVVHTDIERDGMMQGLNLDATLELAQAVPIPVIASGGLSSMDDIHRLVQPDARILAGAITGRALYDGRIDIKKALALFNEAKAC